MQIQSIKTVEFERPQMYSGTSCTAAASARVSATPSLEEKAALKTRIKQLLKEKQAVLVAHYYVAPDLQDLAEETGGCVSDSLEMARFGWDHPARTLVVAGVRFMGETAKILSPDKTVLMPECHLFPPPRLSNRRIYRFLRCASGPYRRGICQYQCRGQSAG